MSRGNSSNDGNPNKGGNDDEGWGSKFFKLATAAAATAAVAGGLYSLMSSSSTPQHSPFEASPRRVIEEPYGLSSSSDDEEPYDNYVAPSLQIRRTKPEQGWAKLNVAGSRDHIGYPNSSGCGGVLRDSSGTWLLGFSQKLDPSYDVHMTEIVAILKGVELAKEMNVKKLVVESDHKSAVSMVNNGVRVNHPQFSIISSIKELLSDPKWEVKVFHIPREANRVANKLARDARDLSSMYMRKYPYPPTSCSTLVQEDSQGGGTKFFKLATEAAPTAALAGGLYSLMSSSSTPQHSPFEASARRVIEEPDDEDNYVAPSLQIRWTKPEQGWVKLNVDGSRDHIGYPNSSGCGGVLRDASGTWLLGFSQKLDPSYKVDKTEIEAILKGVELAKEMNVKKLVVESDHKPAVSIVNNGVVRVNHPHYSIISNIKQLLSDPKWQVKVVHIPREANGVADKLAKDARDLSSTVMHMYPYPPNSCSTLVEQDSQGGGDVVFV